MRRLTLLVLLQFAAAAPLAAQFEGTVSMKLSNAGANAGDMTMKMLVKGDQQATILTMPPSAGPMGGMEMRMVYDPKTMTATTLIPLPAQLAQMPALANAKGLKTVIDLAKAKADAAAQQTDEHVDVKKLGTTEKIAGYDCDDYEITSSSNKPMRACIAQSLGHFLFPSLGGMGRGAAQSPAWTKAFGTNPGFPLKVWSTTGEMAMEVTSIERGSVPSSMFEIPEGYVDMKALFGGRGGGL
jgi:hypothetical protein